MGFSFLDEAALETIVVSREGLPICLSEALDA
jgi:hypothetical protein